MSTLPHIEQMEMAVVGAVIENPDINAALVFDRLPLEQFGAKVYHLVCAVWERISERQPVTPQLVLDTMRNQGRLRPETGSLVHDCLAYAYATPSLPHYVDALADLYAQRRLHQLGTRIQQMAGQTELHTTMAYLQAEMSSITDETASRAEDTSLTLAQILAEPDMGPVEWLIDGIIPTSDRVLVTAEEGAGKSVVLRQAALSLALGVGMFDVTEQIKPGRALLVDCENSRRQVVTGLRRMYGFASRHTHSGDPANLVVESRQGGIDLTDPVDQGWLMRMVRTHRPQLIALGPMYRMVGGDINDEVVVRSWQRLFEPLLEEGLSIIMEHHSPNAKDANGRRDLRPIGSSVIRRWFSQGIGIRGRACDRHGNDYCTLCRRQGKIELWRGSRDETHWPTFIESPGSDLWWLTALEEESR